MNGFAVAILGLALCMILCGSGSALALFKTGSAASGVVSEDPKKFSKVFVLAVLPATQGIYGFVVGLMGMSSLTVEMTMGQGFAVVMAALPMTIVGFISAYFQGRTSVSAIQAVAKEDSVSGKLMLFPAMVETYAILSLVISIMLFGSL
ncbi:MAG: V-type ATP synthase subunit K [Clostridiales bacterium]|nr:V-type ATP synthase subunit K [Clostridiales bacterium]